MLAGVCGGIAETYGGDPTAMRLLAVVIGIFTGIFPMLIAYLVAAVVVPEGTPGEVLPKVRHDRSASSGRFGLTIGAILIVVGLAALASEVFHVDSDVVWSLALVGFGAVILVAAGRR
jgi:phage shock protein PspC (stress-responsive transcriptional regulator)